MFICGPKERSYTQGRVHNLQKQKCPKNAKTNPKCLEGILEQNVFFYCRNNRIDTQNTHIREMFNSNLATKTRIVQFLDYCSIL